jgi:hypothetical protein
MKNKINYKKVFILLATHVAIFAAGVYYGLLVYEDYINDEYIVIPGELFNQKPAVDDLKHKGMLSV